MTPDELRERILRWEDLHTDFKREAGADRNELAKDLVCFANTDGGQLLFGVSDDRTVVGVADVDTLLRLIEDVAFERCQPPISVVPETVLIDGVTVVVVNIPKGDQRPYATRSGMYYIRSTQRCRRASREELLRLFQATGSMFYDEQPLGQLALSDLDLLAVERHLAEIGQPELTEDLPRLLTAWRLLDDGTPTVAGLVVFGRIPQVHLPSTGVIAAAFSGNDSGEDLIDRKDLKGGLFDVLGQAQAFLSLHLSTPHVVEGFGDERRPELPVPALREAIVNALVHRDYTVPGPIRVFVLFDRVEVHSPGRPPNTVTAESMRAGVHVTRNPHIYTRAAEAGLVTRAGTGIRRISKLLGENGSSDLTLTVSDTEVVLSLPRARSTVR